MSAGYVELGLSDRVEFVIQRDAARQAAYVAGARGRHAEPLSGQARAIRYARQRGARSIWTGTTPAQRKRLRKKANQADYRAELQQTDWGRGE